MPSGSSLGRGILRRALPSCAFTGVYYKVNPYRTGFTPLCCLSLVLSGLCFTSGSASGVYSFYVCRAAAQEIDPEHPHSSLRARLWERCSGLRSEQSPWSDAASVMSTHVQPTFKRRSSNPSSRHHQQKRQTNRKAQNCPPRRNESTTCLRRTRS